VEQIAPLHRILALKDLGLSLEEIGDLMQEDLALERLETMLHRKQREIERQLHEEQQRLERVRARLYQLQHMEQLASYEVVLKDAVPLQIVGIQFTVPTIPQMKDYRCVALTRLYAWLDSAHITPNGDELALYHMQEYVEENIEMELALPVERPLVAANDLRVRTLDDTGQMACTVHSGSMWDIPQALTSLLYWINTNGYQANGAMREIHRSGSELHIPHVENVVLEFQIPLATRP
jgi:effector-binding domain-containing protein